MSEVNPYASPQVASAQVVHGSMDGLWQDGKILVMHKLAPMPDRCVKSNQPTERRLKRQLYWHHPAIYVSLVVSILLYAILALVLRKSAKIHIGLSDQWFAKRHRAILIGWSLVLLSFVTFGLGIATADSNEDMGVVFFLSTPVLFLVGAIYGLLAARMVAPQKITENFVFLKGVCPEYLEQLPQWPGYDG